MYFYNKNYKYLVILCRLLDLTSLGFLFKNMNTSLQRDIKKNH